MKIKTITDHKKTKTRHCYIKLLFFLNLNCSVTGFHLAISNKALRHVALHERNVALHDRHVAFLNHQKVPSPSDLLIRCIQLHPGDGDSLNLCKTP